MPTDPRLPSDEAAPALRALEGALLTHPGVRECTVLRRAGGAGEMLVVAYVVPEGRLTLDALRQHATATGSALLPDRLVRISSVPLLEDGRVDETALFAMPVVDDATLARVKSAAGDSSGNSEVVVRWDFPANDPLSVSDLLPAQPRPTNTGSKKATTTAAEESAVPSLSVGPAVASPGDAPERLGDLLVRAAARHPDHTVTCLELGAEHVVTYRQLLDRAERTMAGLRAAGVKRGDIVIFQFEHNVDFIEAFWACQLGGFVPVPISVPTAADLSTPATLKLKNAWQLLGRPVVITTADLAPMFERFRSQLDMPDLRILTIEQAQTAPAGERHADPAPDDLALLLLTSGSTGVPKAVTQSHAALLCHVAATRQHHGFTERDVWLNWFPLDHVGGIVMCHILPTGLGSSQVHIRTGDILQEPLDWLDLIERFRASFTWAPNFAYGLINDRIEEQAGRHWDLSSMRFMLNGGEAIVAATARRVMKRLARHGMPATAMRPAWGMSETCSAATFAPPLLADDAGDAIDEFVDVGHPNPGFEMRIVDDDNAIVPEGQEGHMEVRGQCVTRQYLNNPEANESSFTGDGWFRTGDLGRLSNGRLTITGRAKSELIVNGVNYHSHEIEAAIEDVPGVTRSFTAAFGVRERGANTDSLAVAFHTDVEGDEALVELLRRIRLTTLERVGVAPRFLLSVGQADIPKTAIGKIQRPALTKRFAAGELDEFVQRSERLLQRAQTIPNWFFRPVWRRRAVVAHRPVDAATTIVLVSDSNGIGDAFAALAREAGALVVAATRETLAAAVAAVPANQRLIVLLGDRVEATAANHGETAIAEATAFVLVVRTIVGSRLEQAATELIIYERAGRRVVAGDSVDVRGASVRGLLRTVPTEHPELSVRHVDLPSATDAGAALLVAELADRSHEVEVAYRNGERWVVRLAQRRPTRSGRGHTIGANGGFYLITGGLGGLGVEVARQILRTTDVPVLLIGRRPIADSDPRYEALASLQSLGTVHFEPVDVADADTLKRVVADASARWNRELAGVIHLAGVFEPRLIADENDETLNTALHAKVAGTWSVHQLLLERPGAALIAFSSVNGQLGGYSAGAYAAANAFIDEIVEHHARDLGRAAYSLAWSLWDSIGMSREYSLRDSAARRGYQAVSLQQGMVSFTAAVGSEPGQVLIGLNAMNANVRRFLDAASSTESVVVYRPDASESSAGGALRDEFGTTVSYVVRSGSAEQLRSSSSGTMSSNGDAAFGNEIERLIASVWRESLSATHIGPNDNFFDVGGTSLLVAATSRKLRQALGREVQMTDIYRFPTLRLLAAHYGGSEESEAVELSDSEERGRARRAQRMRRRSRDT